MYINTKISNSKLRGMMKNSAKSLITIDTDNEESSITGEECVNGADVGSDYMQN